MRISGTRKTRKGASHHALFLVASGYVVWFTTTSLSLGGAKLWVNLMLPQIYMHRQLEESTLSHDLLVRFAMSSSHVRYCQLVLLGASQALGLLC